MNEHLTHQAERLAPALSETRPAPVRETPDWRRLEVAAGRFGDRIAEGLSHAAEHDTDIDDDTARMIAHVLGRAFGRESALANYGRTGTGYYPEIRDEYLHLYHHTDAGWVTDLIDKYGSYLIKQHHPDAKPLTGTAREGRLLTRLLVPTDVRVGARQLKVHVPGSYGSEAVTELAGTLTELRADEDAALRAFLSLSDVNAMSGDIMQDFHDNYIGPYPSIEDAIHELSGVTDRIDEVLEYAEERHLTIDGVSPDYEALGEEVASGFDIVEQDGRAYAFYK